MRKIEKSSNLYNMLLNLSLLIVSILFVCFFFEIVLRSFCPQDLNYLKLDSVLEYKGIPKIKTTFRTWEFQTIIKLNSKGLRDYEHSYNNPENNYRILVLGDSYTFGYGVEGNETYPKILENLLNSKQKGEYEVISAGMPGWGNNKELAFLETEGLKYNPDLVILGFHINDPIDNLDDNIFSVQDGKLVKEYPSYRFSFQRKIRTFLSSYSHLAIILKHKLGLFEKYSEEIRTDIKLEISMMAGLDSPWVNKGWEKTFLLIDRLKNTLEEKGISLFIVIIPRKEQVIENGLVELTETYNFSFNTSLFEPKKSHIVLSDYLKKKNIAYFDLFDYMNSSFFYVYDWHLNKEGHDFVAQLIYQKLKDKTL